MTENLTHERPKSGERAVLVHVDMYPLPYNAHEEFHELCLAAGVLPVEEFFVKIRTPQAKYFIGKGKVEEIAKSCIINHADIVLFDHSLTPAQERNLEQILKCRVLDRTGLILDIFAQRARSFEGKLQVELAQLQHLATRLVRGWTHLERQKGGIGLRGPGETQLETDRRLLRGRIKSIQSRLEKVEKQRQQGRRSRDRAEVPTLSLVGYTNAGKSTLFNALTHSDVFAAEQLFATLDPTLRQIHIPNYGNAILIDTVGFIRDLPHELVEAFKATLNETKNANLLLHVIDAHDEDYPDSILHVQAVLKDIDADSRPRLEIYNKIDLSAETSSRIDYDPSGKPIRVWLSAKTGEGFDLLQQAISECLGGETLEVMLKLRPNQTRLRAKFYKDVKILNESIDEEGNITLHVRLTQFQFDRLGCKDLVI